MRNMIVRQVTLFEGEVLLFLHGHRGPNRAEWEEAMGLMTRFATTGDFRRMRSLAISDGGGPDAQQRGELQAYFKAKNHSMKTAVMTTSVVTRGIVAAVSWFNPHIKGFSPRNFLDALAHLELPRSHQPRLFREYAEMQRELPPNSCLALVTGASASATV